MCKDVLKVSGLSKNYQSFALSDVSFNLPEGTIMGFIGENGAGKTTTIKAILNLIHRDSGSIEIFGQDNRHAEKSIKENIGVVFSDQNFPDDFRTKDVSAIMRNIYASWDDGLFDHYLNRFALPRNEKLKAFSRGMKMKLLIASALSHHPKLLILDEATSGLDPIVRNEILDIFQEFIQDEHHSIFMSTHITSDLEHIADYITFIHNGRIILSDTKDALIYEHGIARCNTSQYTSIDPYFILSKRQTEFGIDALVQDVDTFRSHYPDVLMDLPTLEDLMLFYIKGEK